MEEEEDVSWFYDICEEIGFNIDDEGEISIPNGESLVEFAYDLAMVMHDIGIQNTQRYYSELTRGSATLH